MTEMQYLMECKNPISWSIIYRRLILRDEGIGTLSRGKESYCMPSTNSNSGISTSSVASAVLNWSRSTEVSTALFGIPKDQKLRNQGSTIKRSLVESRKFFLNFCLVSIFIFIALFIR